MDPAYITHQRRPALIPTNAVLSPEDEQSVRIRTGNVIPWATPPNPRYESIATGGTEKQHSQDGGKCKRKASTTAEEYHEGAAMKNIDACGGGRKE